MVVLFDKMGYKTLMAGLVEHPVLLDEAGKYPAVTCRGLVKISPQDREQEIIVDGQGLIGLEARAPDGTVLGRIMEVLTGEDEGGVTVVTHVVVESRCWISAPTRS